MKMIIVFMFGMFLATSSFAQRKQGPCCDRKTGLHPNDPQMACVSSGPCYKVKTRNTRRGQSAKYPCCGPDGLHPADPGLPCITHGACFEIRKSNRPKYPCCNRKGIHPRDPSLPCITSGNCFKIR
ncbi:MAG: hypothetical protein E2O68_08925 [Deltaproteobacteria bacterium]|nr:MAG: hypothetical protein E2O68_08925 [Deltaproteobacteria bacterium]